MPDLRAVLPVVILQQKPLQDGFNGRIEPSVVAQHHDSAGAVSVEALAGAFVADSGPEAFAGEMKIGRIRSGSIVGCPVEKDLVEPATYPVGEGIGFSERDQQHLVGDAVVALMEEIGRSYGFGRSGVR